MCVDKQVDDIKHTHRRTDLGESVFGGSAPRPWKEGGGGGLVPDRLGGGRVPDAGGGGLGGPELGVLLVGREGGARDGGGGAPVLPKDGLDGRPSLCSEGPFGTRFCDRKSAKRRKQDVHVMHTGGIVQRTTAGYWMVFHCNKSMCTHARTHTQDLTRFW